jgi:hypothetical protein
MLKGNEAVLAAPILDAEDATYRKVTMRIVPFLFFCYLAAYLAHLIHGLAGIG